ncbi:MAG: oligosaccharide flippase family protein, partial [Candidatus Omnitrophica bacterium]|nr:oligosaccharide flippase family protein [Candidatus Omnitrophota bacterium]
MNTEFDFKNQMTEGIRWLGLGQVFGYIVQFFVWVALARILTPEEFGVLGIALVVMNFVLIFNELGMVSAIIQRREISLRHTSTAFWICI